ncbi:MAG: cytochrome c peroxidase [Paracoccaceae bacterium]
MVSGFASLLSAQTMFPALSSDEMAGHYEENDISTLVRQGRLTGPGGAWAAIAARVAAIPVYRRMFSAAYRDIAAGREIDFADISNAIAAYMTFDFRSDSAPFDARLRGERRLSPQAEAGMSLFYWQGRVFSLSLRPASDRHEVSRHGRSADRPGKGRAIREPSTRHRSHEGLEQPFGSLRLQDALAAQRHADTALRPRGRIP